jgi:regulator of sigma E protease
MPEMLLSIIEFVIMIGVLAFLHESGHYLVARLFKIEVEEFGLGLPPRMFRLFKIGPTEFTINWIPFGAFVRPKGENNPEIAGGLAAAHPAVRVATMLGGPAMNILTGILIFSFLFQQIGVPDTRTIKIQAVSPGSPAAQTGILPGDIVTKINGQTLLNTDQLIQTVTANRGKEITLTYQRGSQATDIKITPRVNPPAGEGALGIQMSNPMQPINYGQSLLYSVNAVVDITRQMVLLPYHLIQGQIAPAQARVVGPVGMYGIYEKARQNDVLMQSAATTSNENLPLNTIYLIALISVAMGFTNLLPIPALDGGRILFTLPELFFNRRVPPEYENMIHLVGFAALILLMVFITAQDIINPIVIP